MNCRTLVAVVQRLERGQPAQLSFLAPITTAGLAAYLLHNGNARGLITLEGDALAYAESVGFTAILRGDVHPRPQAVPRRTMSPLTSLVSAAEVEACNVRVTSILRETLTVQEDAAAQPLRDVVGELHDNVASHASGRGYSALQVYAAHAEFAVADFGRGFRRNVRRLDPAIETDEAAIAWALVPGHTTARPLDPFAQRTGEDRDEQVEANHHMGIGLWRLVQLVERTAGKLWIWSGTATYLREGDQARFSSSPVPWPGVMIELEVPKMQSAPRLGDFSLDELDAVASELGL